METRSKKSKSKQEIAKMSQKSESSSSHYDDSSDDEIVMSSGKVYTQSKDQIQPKIDDSQWPVISKGLPRTPTEPMFNSKIGSDNLVLDSESVITQKQTEQESVRIGFESDTKCRSEPIVQSKIID